MAQSTVDLVRSIVSLIEDKKERTLLKKEIAKHDESRASAEAAVAELKEVQADLADMHESIERVDVAREMEEKAAMALRSAREEAEKKLVNARHNVKTMYEEHDAWYADVQAREITVGQMEASLKQDRTQMETELHKREVLIRQQEQAASKREEMASKLVDEYQKKLSVLKQNVSELHG